MKEQMSVPGSQCGLGPATLASPRKFQNANSQAQSRPA